MNTFVSLFIALFNVFSLFRLFIGLLTYFSFPTDIEPLLSFLLSSLSGSHTLFYELAVLRLHISFNFSIRYLFQVGD